MEALTFPDRFVWGAATAAYQIEGTAREGGRGRSIWDTFSREPGRVRNGDTGDIACDHYHRLDEDLDLLVALGLTSYRFSVAWPRIQPEGRGPANQAGLDFYRRLVDGLRDRGIKPALTIYHWDLPQALEDEGGWVTRDTTDRLADFAAILGQALGDRVDQWITLNEPWCSSWLGYGVGRHAPGQRDVGAAVAANHHLLLAHGRAVQALRSVLDPQAQIGVTLNLKVVRAAGEHPDDVAAARHEDGVSNRMFLDPIFRASYPEDVRQLLAAVAPGFAVEEDGDLDAIAQPLDFLGINFYSPTLVASPDRVREARRSGLIVRSDADVVSAAIGVREAERPNVVRTAMGWEVEPDALYELLRRVRSEYTELPIYITENGAACDDYVDPNGQVNDSARIDYLDRHLRAVHRAIAEGVDVRGYFVWSLMDNFEWALGYSRRFGLLYVDYPTGTRIPKASYEWYRRVIAANALPARA